MSPLTSLHLVKYRCLQLEQELKKVEAVIDTVVDSHHLGFNHAIENYSKILSLFNECKAQVCDLWSFCRALAVYNTMTTCDCAGSSFACQF